METLTGNTVHFRNDLRLGSDASLITGNIIFDTAEAIAGAVAVIFHQDASEPVWPAGVYRQDGSTYTPGSLNLIYLQYLSASRIEMVITSSTAV